MVNVDSAAPLSTRLDSVIISITRQRHHAIANVILGNVIVSKTQQRHHAMTNIASVATSHHDQRRLDSVITYNSAAPLPA
jgi:hypothetical protein